MRNASVVATTAIKAVNAQHTTVPGQQIAAAMVARLAKEVMTLDTEIGDTETMIEDRFRRHHHAGIILSMPGFDVLLAAEFLAATGGEMTGFDSIDRLAGVSGLAPVPRDSGRVSGNRKRPRRYDRRPLRARYLSAQISIRTEPASRTYYDRNRSEGKTTPKLSSPWPAEASTSSGPCSATTPRTSPQPQSQRLDNVIENPPDDHSVASQRRCK